MSHIIYLIIKYSYKLKSNQDLKFVNKLIGKYYVHEKSQKKIK